MNPNASIPSDGERNALVGYSAQFVLAAKVVKRNLPVLEWIRLADPEAGIADDFQFLALGHRHALQVKWSQFPGAFTWSDLAGASGHRQSLLGQLASAWCRLRKDWDGPLTIHLCTNNFPSRTTASAGTALASAKSQPRHLAAFLHRAVFPLAEHLRLNPDERWKDVSGLNLVTEWSDAWTALLASSELTEDQFPAFLRDFTIDFIPLDQSEIVSTHDSADLAHLANILQSTIVDPTRPIELSRTELMQRLGWEARLKYQNPHRFPVPENYTANDAARMALEHAIHQHTNGYLALVGPPGSGKSTLVESLFLAGRVIRYYAYVPDAPDPFSGRGEAQSFMHDLSLALEEAGIRRKGFGTDLIGQREILFDQLTRAGDRFKKDGVRTTIIIDGLDHIPREQNPMRSLLDELPPPSALTDGVCILIGSQTVSILPLQIRQALTDSERVVDLPPLSDGEVETITTLAGVTDWLAPGQLSTLIERSEGHPLVLTYMIRDLRALEIIDDIDERRHNAEQTLKEASEYRGNIDLRYAHYLGSLLDDPEILSVLGTVSRLRIPIDLNWLETWAAPATVTRFAERTHTFFHRDGREWTFVHNSFRRFLVEQTALVGGEHSESRSRELHEQLAAQCAASINWPQYQDEELAQRYLAGQFQLVLNATVPDVLRQNLFNGRPYGVVRDQARIAARAAAEARDYGALLRTLMFLNELNQRGYVLSAEEIAKTFCESDPRSAVEHTVQGRSLRIATAPALEIASTLAASNRLEEAEMIIRATGGLQGIVGERNYDQRAWAESIANWSEIMWHRSGVIRVLDELDHLLPVPTAEFESVPEFPLSGEDSGLKASSVWNEAREERQATIAARDAVHARCFDLANAIRDESAMALIAKRIDAESDIDWRARKHVINARSAQVDGETAEVLRQVQMMLTLEKSQTCSLSESASGHHTAGKPDEDDEEIAPPPRRIVLALRVAAAEVLARAGLAETDEFVRLLPPETKAAWPTSGSGSEGLAPYTTMLGVLRMRALAKWINIYDHLPADGLTAPGWDLGPARTRFSNAITRLAELEAQSIASTLGIADPPDVPALADPVVRLLDVSHETTRKWTSWYLFVNSASDLYARLIGLAYRCGGYAQLERLTKQFKQAWDSPERSAYWPISRRVRVIQALSRFSQASEWCAGEIQSLETLIDKSTDPHDNVTAWLEVSKARAEIGDRSEAISAVGNAHRSGWGPAQHHDDYQLVSWLAWLVDGAKTGEIGQETFLEEARTYARRLIAAADGAESQASEAAGNLVQSVFGYDAGLAIEMGEALCDYGVFSEVEMVLAITKATAESSEVESQLATSLLTDLLMPLSTDTPTEIEDLLVENSADTDEVAERITRAKHLWSIPTGWRSEKYVHEGPSNVATEPETVAAIQLPTMLRQMRDSEVASVGEQEIYLWTRTVTEFEDVVPPALAVELLKEAERLALRSTTVAAIAGLAVRAGAVEQARAALSRVLARTEPYGWIRHYDGGSRIALFEAASQQAGDHLVDLAAHDLAGLVASGTIGGDFTPKDLRRFAMLFGGKPLVAQCWSTVSAYLDEFAPAAEELPALELCTSESPEVEVLEWVGRQLGHPVRIMDFGARRILATAHETRSSLVEGVLTGVLADRGWAAEAALQVLTQIRYRREFECPEILIPTLTKCAGDKDALLRLLSLRLLALEDVEAPPLNPKELPGIYKLDMPYLPPRSIPELDSHGVPYIDMTDPQQVIGPFDQHLIALADEFNLDAAVLVHRAATLGNSDANRWTKGGHRAHADRLKIRGNFHTYRPWAYMVGRRGCSEVLAELIDARVIPDGVNSLFLEVMADEATSWITPLPLDATTPMPWRDLDNKDYPSEDWCSEASDAADWYASEFSNNKVLAEMSRWRWLAWGVPEEERLVRTRHGERWASSLTVPLSSAWENTIDIGSRYPALRDINWPNGELVVQGHAYYSDIERLDWLALHPAVAHELGWAPGQRQFEWIGIDGSWRARTILRICGQLSHKPPSDATCAEVWQVILSDQGWAELSVAFPGLIREVHVQRILPESRREERELIVTASSSTVVDS